jgi:hypothetical protein
VELHPDHCVPQAGLYEECAKQERLATILICKHRRRKDAVRGLQNWHRSHSPRAPEVSPLAEAPNTLFGVQNKKPSRENKDTKERNRDSANDTAVGEGGPPPKTFRTASSMKQSLLQLSGSARKQPTPAAARPAPTSSVADLDFEEETE